MHASKLVRRNGYNLRIHATEHVLRRIEPAISATVGQCNGGVDMMLLAIAVGVLVGSMTTAMAQAYPSRPITIIVPFPPGGNTDIMARALQVEISKSLRQTIIINNKSGASGTLGIRDFVKAEPDGYTLRVPPHNTPP